MFYPFYGDLQPCYSVSCQPDRIARVFAKRAGYFVLFELGLETLHAQYCLEDLLPRLPIFYHDLTTSIWRQDQLDRIPILPFLLGAKLGQAITCCLIHDCCSATTNVDKIILINLFYFRSEYTYSFVAGYPPTCLFS